MSASYPIYRQLILSLAIATASFLVACTYSTSQQSENFEYDKHSMLELPAPAMMTAEGGALNSEDLRPASEPSNSENYVHFDDNPLQRVSEHPVSTFSIDVDTGAYANVRRFLNQGQLPPRDAVRIEELVNYFAYDYMPPKDVDRPFNFVTEVGPTPWNKNTQLLHVGIKGYQVPGDQLPAANLVFLIDVSGSMDQANKLPLLKSAMKMLSKQMTGKDRISIVVYAGASGVVLEPTPGNNTATIAAALDRLAAGGSTNGAAGIQLAYALAEQGFIANGVNRVVLATDGDFNVGTTNIEQLKQLIESKRASGIAMTTLGFGMGNYNDYLMEQIAAVGNGNYAYIDTLNEARKVLVDQIAATLLTIANDVKIQIEFNPAAVSEYRLIGYVNRLLKREDFANDKIDAGEIGAGHTVTAIYEIALVGGEGGKMPPLRYGSQPIPASEHAKELAHLRLRYKVPGGEVSKLIEHAITRDSIQAKLANTSQAFRFSAAVAAFGQLLRGGRETNNFVWQDVHDLALSGRGQDPFGYRSEFLQLVSLAGSLESKGRP